MSRPGRLAAVTAAFVPYSLLMGLASVVLLLSIGSDLPKLGWSSWPLAVPGLIIAWSQWVFLLPEWTPRLDLSPGGRRRSLYLSMVAAAWVAAVLFAGLLLAFLDLTALALQDAPVHYDSDVIGWVAMALFGLSWTAWMPVFAVFCARSDPDTLLSRVAALLLAGTIAEQLVIVPILLLVRARTSCLCATGTFFALAASAAVVVWLVGPGVVLGIRATRRTAWRRRSYPSSM